MIIRAQAIFPLRLELSGLGRKLCAQAVHVRQAIQELLFCYV